MTFNGWLQIALFSAIVIALTRPFGGYMTRVFAGERTFLSPVLRPLERLRTSMKALAADVVSALPVERRRSLGHHQKRLDATIAKSFEDAEEKRGASIEDRQGLGIPRTH